MKPVNLKQNRKLRSSNRVFSSMITLRIKFKLLAGIILASSFFYSAYAQELPDKLKGHGGPIKAISISPDGEHVLTASFDYSIIYWRITEDKAELLYRLEGHDAAVNDVAFIPEREEAISVSDDGSLGIWNLKNGTLIKRLDAPVDKVLDVALSPDGKFAAVARWDETARIYDLEKQTEVAVLKGHRGNVNSVTFSSDGTKLYSAAYDGQVIEWDIASQQMIRPIYRHGWGINSIVRLDEDRILFGSLDGTVAVVSIEKAEKIQDIAQRERPIQAVKLSSDGALAAYGDGAGWIEVFAANSGKKIEGGEVTFGPVWDFDFVSGTNQIYHVGLDDFASRWQVSPNKLQQNRAEFPRRFQIRDTNDLGELEFRRKCSVCHTLTPDGANRAGPTLYDLFGRKAGTLEGYNYSDALLKTDVVWNAETIAQLFDDGPDVMLPGTKMPIQRLKRIERRDDLIHFLKEATKPVK